MLKACVSYILTVAGQNFRRIISEARFDKSWLSRGEMIETHFKVHLKLTLAILYYLLAIPQVRNLQVLRQKCHVNDRVCRPGHSSGSVSVQFKNPFCDDLQNFFCNIEPRRCLKVFRAQLF